MKRLLSLTLGAILFLAGCGEDNDPTRNNDFVPLTSITVTSAGLQVPAGFTNRFAATGDFSGAFTRDITGEVTWASSDPAILAFDDPASGLARGVAPGPVTVTASGDGITGALDFTVSDATLQSIAVDPASAAVAKGLTQQFIATGTFSDGSTLVITPDVIWTSGNTTLVTVNGAGLANAVAVGGPVEITAGPHPSAPTVTGSAQMTVTNPVLESVRVTPADPVLTVNETQPFTAVAINSDGSESPITNATWTSSNQGVATIAATGVATAVANGTSTISAMDPASGQTGTTTLTVATVTGITIAAIDPISVGQERQLTATATLSNGSTRDITAAATWNSNQPGVAAVGNDAGNKGLVTGIAAGSAVITATKSVQGSISVTVQQP